MLTKPAVVVTCDNEPIHILGAIQSIGFLLSVDIDWITVRASANVCDFLHLPHAEVVGRGASSYLPAELLHEIRGRLQQAGEAGVAEPLFGRRLVADGPTFAIAVHQSGHETVLEFEAEDSDPAPLPTAVRAIISRVERHKALPAVFREATRQIRALTGFDRVMLYRFHEDGHGEVVGESARNGLVSFMGLHYPASDIPAQARALYLRNLVRIIADVAADPVAILPEISSEGERLDLSMSVLRSTSPVHIEYLRNMGVGASMSISILQGGRLWGLIACHHMTAHHLNLQKRLTAELFGQMFSYLLEVRVGISEAAYNARVQQIHNHIATAFAAPEASLANIPEFISDLTDYVASDGIATYIGSDITLVGLTPTQDEFRHLVLFLTKTAAGRVFATQNLAAVFSPAADYAMRAAGILAIPLSRIPRDYLVFFRRETIETVTWAGEPVKIEATGPSGIRLTPRKSFEAWRETVRATSVAWAAAELRAAESLRLTLVEVVLRVTNEAQADQLKGLHYQELLIAELNHRVRNLLGLVRGLVIQVAAKSEDVKTLVDGLDSRLRAMGRAYDLLTLNSWTSGSLHGLLQAEMAAYGELVPRLVLVGPDVMLLAKGFSAMALVIHELVTNACKYGALKAEFGQVVVTTGTDRSGNVTVKWHEIGGPAVVPPQRRGFGTTIIEQAIPFEISGQSVSRYLPTGICVDFVLPLAVATLVPVCVEAAAAADAALPPGANNDNESFGVDEDANGILSTCLVVEDNLFIAIDVEDLLRTLGAKSVIVAKSVAEALELLGDHRVSFALLDVNLGTETSLPVAQALQAQNIPFIFGTGYGTMVALPNGMEKITVISKPYNQNIILKAVTAFA